MTTAVALRGYRTLVVGRPHEIEPQLLYRGVSPAFLLNGPQGLRRWLAGMPPQATVGVPGQLETCPLALYLRCSGVQHPYVGGKAVRWGVDQRNPRNAPSFALPAWAREFVKRVDGDWRECISAGRALVILGECGA